MGKEEKAKAEKKKAEKKAEKNKAENVKGADNSPIVYDKIPFYPFTYVAKDINGNVLGSYYVEFKIRIIKQKNVEYVVELFPLYSTNVITEFSFLTQRTKNNIEKNAKRLFNLDKSGYPGRDGLIFNDEVSKVIFALFNNPSSQKAKATATSVEVETTSSIQPGDSIIIGNASYSIVTIPTSTTPNGTCFLYDMVQGVSSFSIPSSIIYQGVTYTVVSIGTPGSIYNCFADVKDLTSVSIPTSVTYVAVSAFYNCSDLSTLIIPSGSLLQSIDTYAFLGAHLTYVGTNNDGYNSFQNCTLLTSIGTYAFYDLWLENFIINSTVSSGCTIGDYAFYNCNFIGTGGLSGFNTLKLGGVVSIGDNAFGMSSNNVNAFTTVSLDPKTTSIGASAFYNCLSITTLYVPSGSQLQSIGDFAFGNNKDGEIQLTYIGTGSGDYPWNSFQNCSQLSYIGVNAFYNLFLRNLIINSSALGGCTISDSAFYNCNFIGTGGDGFPSGFNTLQLGGVVSIGVNAFGISNNNVNAYTSVSLDPTTQIIGESAFFNCLSIATLVIPSGSQLQSIGDNAFNNNKDNDFGLTYIGTGSGNWNSFANCSQLSYIGISAFYNTWIQNLTIASTATSGCIINSYAFYNSDYIGKNGGTSNNVQLGGVISIGQGAFEISSGSQGEFETVTLDPTTTYIGISAFYNCTSLVSLVIPTSSLLQSIDTNAFQETDLTYIGTGPSNWNSFSNCTLLNNIGSSAFYDLWLTTLAFNSISTLTIGNDAFYKCNYITSINFIGDNNNDNIIINSSAFAECVILNEVTILPTTQFFASNAFSGCSALQNSSVNGTINTSAIPNQISDYFSVANGFYVNFNIIS